MKRETIEYRGREITMFYDEYAESPDTWGNEDVFLVSYNRRELWVVPKYWEYSHDALYECKGFHEGYYVFPVSIYSHSGLALCMGNRGGWDFSNGWAFMLVKRERGSWTRTDAMKRAEGMLEMWNDYLSGHVYGYKTEDDACGGYYGEEGYKCAVEDAKAHIDYVINQEQKAFIERKKVELRNHIPMQYRTTWNFVM